MQPSKQLLSARIMRGTIRLVMLRTMAKRLGCRHAVDIERLKKIFEGFKQGTFGAYTLPFFPPAVMAHLFYFSK